MRAVDTNVLVRFFVADDPLQFRRARRLLEAGAVFIPKTVLLETEWVLRHAYGLAASDVLRAFGALSGTAEVQIEDSDAVLKALAWFGEGMDFADALHIASRGGASEFVTFDKSLASAARKAGIGGVTAPRASATPRSTVGPATAPMH